MATLLTASEETKKVIKVCISPGSMPIETIENSKHIGMAADFLTLIGDRSGQEMELLSSQSWGESLAFAKEGLCDILSAAEKNDELKDYFRFTDPYMEFPIVIISRANMPFVSSLESIKDQRIATLASAEYIELLKKRYPKMQVLEMSNTQEGLKAVLGGEIDYFLDITADLAYVTRKFGISGVNIVGFTGDDFHYRIAVQKSTPVLFDKMQSAVQSITTEEKQHIFNRWIDAKIEVAIDYSLIWKVLFFILLGYLIFYIWNRKLTKEIGKRREAEWQLIKLNSSLETRIDQQVQKIREKDLLMHHQSRLAHTGELLSNIAHQWRQPLSRLSSLFMQAELQAKEGKFHELDFQNLIRQNNGIVEHMSQTIEDFTHFFQMDSQDPVYFDPIEPCREAIGIIEDTFKSNNITIHKSCPQSSLKLCGYPRAFSHVVFVLLSNANDVLKKENITKPEIWIEMTADNDHVFLTVEDNGGGIGNEIIYKIFDPYFTTKSKEEGSGIGLYMASSIIQRVFHGSISVSNTEKGAKFLIEIPCKI